MKIFCHNFDPSSNSGPNKFTRQLMNTMMEFNGVKVVSNQTEADAEFALIHLEKEKVKPTLLRLDGIYFNSAQNYYQQNQPIMYSYQSADCVIFQSMFNKGLTEHWFGTHKNTAVIHNAADLTLIEKAYPLNINDIVHNAADVWSCASSWRPHKRLEDNLRYFLEFSGPKDIMLVAGKNADVLTIKKYNRLTNGRVYYLGDLNYFDLLSVYKASSKFVHLSYLDHCPNVVVDAQAAGCKIICSSSGGTKEIVTNGEMILEDLWDYSPIELYNPPPLNFSKKTPIKKDRDEATSIKEVSQMYFDKISSII